jgi:hypothetical protein
MPLLALWVARLPCALPLPVTVLRRSCLRSAALVRTTACAT